MVIIWMVDISRWCDNDHGVTMVRVNPESINVVEPRTPVELAVDEVFS